MTELEALQLLIKKKELGITDLELQGFMSSLNHTKLVVPELKPEEIVKPMSPLDDFTEEEILFYATPYFDELQAKRKAMQEKKDLEMTNG